MFNNYMAHIRCMGAAAALTVSAMALGAQPAPMAKPEQVGFTADGLQKITEVVKQHIDAGDIPGAITLVARNGRIAYLDAQGVTDAQTKTPMKTDMVFWVASMTKPFVGATVMMMVEAGKVKLDDPVSKFVPEFKVPQQVRVLKPGSPDPAAARRGGGPPDPNAPKPEFDLVPATREMTVKDLLTHTSGIQGIGVANPTAPAFGDSLSAFVAGWGAVPRDFQPGSRWAYSNAAAFDVLARIVEVTSGKPYDQFIKERVWQPLGITDASFGPNPALQARTLPLAGANATNPCVAGKMPCGSAGMWISAEGYWRFAQMLTNKGQFNGKRLLKASTVEQMAANHAGDVFPGSGGLSGKGTVMGLSMLAVTDPAAAGTALPKGSFGWDGVGSRRFWAVPQENMVIVMLLPGGMSAVVHRDIEKSVMAALKK